MKGYLPHDAVKGFVFWVLTACIAASTVSGILRSWGTIGEIMANRCLWTAFVLALGSIAFLVVNCVFGELGQTLLGQGSPSRPVDPAFTDRLRQSKVSGQHPDDSHGAGRG